MPEQKGEIILDRLGSTAVPGQYAAGDVTDNPFKQAVTAASEGVIAANNTYKYCKG